jgi:hypothetical protein
MSRPLLEVADLIRSAGTAFIERNRNGSAGPISRSCWPSRAVAPPHSAVISMNAPVADIVPPSRTTAVAIGTVRSVRAALANAGSEPGAANFSPLPTSMSSSPCPRNWQRWPYRIKRSSIVLRSLAIARGHSEPAGQIAAREIEIVRIKGALQRAEELSDDVAAAIERAS